MPSLDDVKALFPEQVAAGVEFFEGEESPDSDRVWFTLEGGGYRDQTFMTLDNLESGDPDTSEVMEEIRKYDYLEFKVAVHLP